MGRRPPFQPLTQKDAHAPILRDSCFARRHGHRLRRHHSYGSERRDFLPNCKGSGHHPPSPYESESLRQPSASSRRGYPTAPIGQNPSALTPIAKNRSSLPSKTHLNETGMGEGQKSGHLGQNFSRASGLNRGHSQMELLERRHPSS